MKVFVFIANKLENNCRQFFLNSYTKGRKEKTKNAEVFKI
jgi:hypothetical protein